MVIAALTFSLIEAMLILPAHLAHMKPQKFDGAQGAFLKFQRRIADSLLWFAEFVFKPVVEAALKFRWITVSLFVVMFMWSVGLMASGIVPFRFQPEIEDDLVQISIELPDGTPFVRSEQVGNQVSRGVELAKVAIMERYPDVDEDLIKGASLVVSERRIQGWIATLVPEKRPVGLSTKEIADLLREKTGPIPDAEEINFSFTVNQNDGGYRVALSHPDLDILRAAAAEVKAQLATYQTTYDIGDNLSSAAPELRFALKPGAEALGVTLASVSEQVRQAYFGELVGRNPRDGEDVEVRVRYPQSDRRSLDSIQNMRIRTADGREIPMSQVASVTETPGINRIYRRDRVRSVAVFSELTGDVRGEIEDDLKANFWPDFEQRYPDVVRGSLGSAESEGEFFGALLSLYGAAFLLMYVLLAIAFKSYFQPLLIMTAIPFGFAGAVFGHMMFGIPLALFSFFGIGAAAGVVINDNLVLIDYVNRRRDEGYGAVQALVEGTVSRFRPILLTSITTFVGILPMIMENSIQAAFLKPMVVALGCAVAFAIFVSLFMVPALYAVGAEIGRFFQWMYTGKPYRSIGEGYDPDLVDVKGKSDADDAALQPAE